MGCPHECFAPFFLHFSIFLPEIGYFGGQLHRILLSTVGVFPAVPYRTENHLGHAGPPGLEFRGNQRKRGRRSFRRRPEKDLTQGRGPRPWVNQTFAKRTQRHFKRACAYHPPLLPRALLRRTVGIYAE